MQSRHCIYCRFFVLLVTLKIVPQSHTSHWSVHNGPNPGLAKNHPPDFSFVQEEKNFSNNYTFLVFSVFLLYPLSAPCFLLLLPLFFPLQLSCFAALSSGVRARSVQKKKKQNPVVLSTPIQIILKIYIFPPPFKKKKSVSTNFILQNISVHTIM